ncbi:unnamed protein product [Rotaria sordida]|uniref:Uncharacterized protein n=1 Tax=Rotaria sordida TaxID=392033 RepID=A0A814ZCY6_9BILA|nr:unnamed protein product [Rotaria sordida]
MNSSNEFNQIDENSILINHEKIYKNKIEDDLYDVKEIMDESINDKYERIFNIQTDIHETLKSSIKNDNLDKILHISQCNLITNNDDIIHYPKNNSEDFQSSIKSKLIIRQSIDSFLKFNQSEDDGHIEPNTTPEDSLTINEYHHFNFNNYINNNEEEENITTKVHHHLKTKYSFITEHPLTHVDSQHAILIEQELTVISNEEKQNDQFQSILFDNEHQQMEKKTNEEQNIVLLEKTDLKDLNPYEPCPSQLLIHKESQENQLNIIPITKYSYEDNQSSINSLLIYHHSRINIEYCTISKYFLLPQFTENHIECFQQLWSPQVYLTKFINFNTSKNILSIHWSLIILFSKLIITGLYIFYSYIKILRYDLFIFSFYYLLGLLFGMNAYLFIDFILLLTCFIYICMNTYKKCFFYYIDLNKYDNELTNMKNKNQYWKLFKLVAYGFAIGIISTYFM